jgi:hypothetical protein
MTESVVLSILGNIGGLLLSTWIVQLLWRRLTAELAAPLLGSLTVQFDFSPDIRVLGRTDNQRFRQRQVHAGDCD